MASIATKLTRNLRLLSLCNNKFAVKSIQRNLFAPSAIGIEGFQKQKLDAESQVLNNRENLKRRITEGLANNTQLFTEDVKTFLFLVKNDEELDIFKKCLEKYEENSTNLGISEYSFGPQVMRLLYLMNKPDAAIEMFFNQKLKNSFASPSSLLILLNKLNEDRRYEDTIKVFDRVLALPNYFFNPKFNAVAIPQDITKLVVEALYHHNNPEAINKLKALISKIKETPNQRISRMAATQAVFTAIKHKDYDYALELTSALEDGGLKYNLKAIAFALLNRFNDSFEQIQKVLGLEYANDQNRASRDVFVYPATLKYLRESIEAKNDNDALKKFEEVSKSVFAVRRLSRSEITDIFTRVIMTRMGPKGLQGGESNRFGGDSNRFGGDSNRFGGPGQRFNQERQGGFRPDSERLGGFRPPRGEFDQDRPQSDRFQQGGRPPRGGFNQERPQFDRFQQQNRTPRKAPIDDDDM